MSCRPNCWTLAAALWTSLALGPASAGRAAEIELLGVGALPGDLADLSGARGAFADGTPRRRLGGFSALEYTGVGNRYLALSDRGPHDGAVEYACRWHELEIAVNPAGARRVDINLVATTLLRDERGDPFVGLASRIDPLVPERSLRLDPEGLRLGRDGTVYVADEYGPHLLAFSRSGQLQRRLAVPAPYKPLHLRDSPKAEDGENRVGRQSNKGFEGLAISPDGRRLYAALQGPLLQDLAPASTEGLSNRLVRMLEIDLDSGGGREFLYLLEAPGRMVSAALALDAERLLILERDPRGGPQSASKAIYAVELSRGAEVPVAAGLAGGRLPRTVSPLSKRLFLDLLDDRFGLRPQLPGKIEGLAFGPQLPDGRRLLLVCSDNDFQAEQPSRIYAFAVRE